MRVCPRVCMCWSVEGGARRAKPAPLSLCSSPPPIRPCMALRPVPWTQVARLGWGVTEELRRDQNSLEPSHLRSLSPDSGGACWFARLFTHSRKIQFGAPSVHRTQFLAPVDAQRTRWTQGPPAVGHRTAGYRVQGLIKGGPRRLARPRQLVEKVRGG